MGMHEVMIDEDAALSAIDELAGGGTVSAPGQPQGQLVITEPTLSEWMQIAKMAAQILAHRVTPNWEVPPEVQQEWAEALAGCLDQLFPGGLANIANWGPWAKLAYASVMWGMCGMDYQTMTMKPLREPQPDNGGEQGQGEQRRQGTAPAAQATAVKTEKHMMG